MERKWQKICLTLKYSFRSRVEPASFAQCVLHFVPVDEQAKALSKGSRGSEKHVVESFLALIGLSPAIRFAPIHHIHLQNKKSLKKATAERH